LQRHVKIFFATDIHGSEKCYRKFLNAGKFYGVEVLILGGDITGKALVPVMKRKDGSYQARVDGREQVIYEDGLQDVLSTIRSAGLYPYIATEEEIQDLASDKEKLRRVFEGIVRKSLDDWMQLARERAKPHGIEVYIQPGNDDEPAVLDAMSSDFVVNPEGKLIHLRDAVPMISYGHSNRTPWNSPRELDEEQLAAEIDKMAARLPNYELAVFNMHVPPKDATIDRAPMLDEDLKPVVRAGEIQMAGAGSIAVREAIQKYQPLLSLHGHIHESGGMAKIGRTIAINPGSEYSDGILRGALITVDTKKKQVHYQLTSG
jgi:Icc-related predicted phosphoesterase